MAPRAPASFSEYRTFPDHHNLAETLVVEADSHATGDLMLQTKNALGSG